MLPGDLDPMVVAWPADSRRALGHVVGSLEGAVGDVVEQFVLSLFGYALGDVIRAM